MPKGVGRSSLKFRLIDASGQDQGAGLRQFLYDSDDLIGIAELIVVPHVEHKVVAIGDGGQTVDNPSVRGAHEVGRDHLWRMNIGNLLPKIRIQGHPIHEIVDLLAGDFLIEREVQDRHGHVGRGHPNGVAGELSGELRQGLGNRFSSPGFGEHHV